MAYHLTTHQLILTVGGIEFIWSENIFQKFLDKLIVTKNGSEVEIFFPENSIAFLRVNWYFPQFQGQKNEIFSARGGMSVNMSLLEYE